MWVRILLIILIAWTGVACRGTTQPQRPTFYGQQEGDSAAMNRIRMNQTMAESADLLLAKTATEEYVLMDENYWVKGLKGTQENTHGLQEGEYVDLEIKCYDLKDNLLCIHQANVCIGQVEEMQAVVLVLPHVQHNMNITLLVPWYLAFGAAGNTQVPPYENLKVEVMVK